MKSSPPEDAGCVNDRGIHVEAEAVAEGVVLDLATDGVVLRTVGRHDDGAGSAVRLEESRIAEVSCWQGGHQFARKLSTRTSPRNRPIEPRGRRDRSAERPGRRSADQVRCPLAELETFGSGRDRRRRPGRGRRHVAWGSPLPPDHAGALEFDHESLPLVNPNQQPNAAWSARLEDSEVEVLAREGRHGGVATDDCLLPSAIGVIELTRFSGHPDSVERRAPQRESRCRDRDRRTGGSSGPKPSP